MNSMQTGTINAAALMGWSDKVGELTPGHWADVIAVEGDPLKDVKVLQQMKFVMVGGKVVKEPGAK